MNVNQVGGFNLLFRSIANNVTLKGSNILELPKAIISSILNKLCCGGTDLSEREVTADPASKRIKCYLELRERYPEIFFPSSADEGEIEILPDSLIQEAEKAEYRFLSKKFPEHAKEWSRVGVLAEDRYLLFVHDPVKFPDGTLGVYKRIISKHALSGCVGVAILPILPNKKIVLNVIYRSTTRSWELEIPRGFRHKKESANEAALRELKEETGYRSEVQLLGKINSDTGISGSSVPLFAALIEEESTEEVVVEKESILRHISLTKEQILSLLSEETMKLEIKGIEKTVHCRDPFLAASLLLANSKGLT